MGSVHLAEDEVLRRPVAIKVVHADPASDQGRRVQREARLGARLAHPNLVAVFDVHTEGDRLLLVMEHVDGETLADTLRSGPFDGDRALAVLRPLAGALDHVHAGGVVHRDVKPANVLLDRRGAVKLADLGVATSDQATRITHTGGLLGTAAYMAPEQFDPGPVTPSADIYALATVAFEMLTGRRPYTGASAFEVMHRIRAGAPPDAREVRPDLPLAAARTLQRGMAVKPEGRPITASALVDELEAGLRPLASPSGPASPAAVAPSSPEYRRVPEKVPTGTRSPEARRRRRRTALLGVAGVLAAVALVAVLVASTGDDGGGGRAASTSRTSATTRRSATTTGTTTGAAPAASAPASGTTATSPQDAVRRFYTLAAADDLDGAWALASPNLRVQLGPRSRFDGTFRTLERISFDRLEPTGTTVALTTTATHTDRVDRCRGSATTVRTAGRWLVDHLAVKCTSTPTG